MVNDFADPCAVAVRTLVARWRPATLPGDGHVTVTDRSFGSHLLGRHDMTVVSRDVASLFTEGWCWALAAVLAHRNQWQIRGVGDDDWYHVVASPRPGVIVDVYGIAGPNWEWGDPADTWVMQPGMIRALDTDSATDPTEAILAATLLAPAVEALCVGR